MSQIKTDGKQFSIKGNPMFLIMAIAALAMAILGLTLISGLLLEGEEILVEDLPGVFFMAIWLTVVTWMGIYALTSYSKKIVIDETGVTCTSLFRSVRYDWYEIGDFGLSYSGRERGGGNIYDLYFSKNSLSEASEHRKRLKGDVIKTFIFSRDYYLITEDVIPFCQRFTSVRPFVARDEFHFI